MFIYIISVIYYLNDFIYFISRVSFNPFISYNFYHSKFFNQVIRIISMSLLSETRNSVRMDPRLEYLLERFEHEAEPYDKLAAYALLLIPVGAVMIALMLLLSGPIVAGLKLYSAIAMVMGLPFIAYAISLYADKKKHEISNTRYKPITGICMCDLSQLRYHIIRFEKSDNYAEKARHARMIEYYKSKIGLKG
jgi:hypothetical protein